VLGHVDLNGGKEVADGVPDRRLVADSQHPHVNLLRQVRCIGFAADSLSKKRLQRRPMRGEQPLHEGRLWGQLPTCPRMKLFPIFYMSPVRPKRTPLIIQSDDSDLEVSISQSKDSLSMDRTFQLGDEL
jgi:hypothetical protein